LTLSQNKNLVREYVKKNFTDHGMIADIALHASKDGKHPHAHIMLTMRPFNEDKTWGAKQRKEYILNPQGEKIYDPGCMGEQQTKFATSPKKKQYKCKSIPATDWNERTKAEEWRASWAETANKYLAQLNHDKRLDHRRYKRQGKNEIPTTQKRILDFLKSNKIENYKGLEKHLQNLMGKQRTTGKKLTPIRHRMNELAEHMQEYETYKTRKAEHDKYQQEYKAQMPWKKKAYEREHG
jgi:ATP-dependent exoDNAse (exonuclease V) alpha subunit